MDLWNVPYLWRGLVANAVVTTAGHTPQKAIDDAIELGTSAKVSNWWGYSSTSLVINLLQIRNNSKLHASLKIFSFPDLN